MGKQTIVVEKYTPKEQKCIAVDNLRAYWRCYRNLVNDRVICPPGIGHGLRDYEDKFEREFDKLLGLIGIDKTQFGFEQVARPDDKD